MSSALTQEVVSPSLADALERAFAPAGGFGGLSAPFERAPALADSVELFMVHDRAGRPVGALQRSAPRGPGIADLVRREVERSRAARAALGPSLGDVVLEPLLVAEADGRSCAAFPLCERLPASRWRWLLERARLAPPLLAWLAEATRLSRREPSPAELERGFVGPLEALAQDARLSLRVRDGARAALRRLEGGQWRPWHALSHEDLWRGNLLRWPARPWWRARPPAWPFVVIDWRGARALGHPFVDLLTAAESLRLRRERLRRELRRHSWIVDCALEDVQGYALASIGSNGLDLGAFEPARWAAGAEALVEALGATLRA